MSLTDEDNSLSQMVTHRSEKYRQKANVRIILDSVVFADGSVVGPDWTNNMRRMNSWTQAERTLLEEMQRRKPEEVSAFLNEASNVPFSRPETMNKIDEFDAHRRRVSQMALLWADQLGTGEAFAAEISSRIASLIPTLHRRGK